MRSALYIQTIATALMYTGMEFDAPCGMNGVFVLFTCLLLGVGAGYDDFSVDGISRWERHGNGEWSRMSRHEFLIPGESSLYF